MNSWIKYDRDCEFSIQNLPFGIYSSGSKSKRVGIAIGDKVLDLSQLVASRLIDSIDENITINEYLNDFISLGKPITNKVRIDVQNLLKEDNDLLKSHSNLSKIMDDLSDVSMHMPVFVRDYTDFYSSRDHATNVGKMFRDPENALLPNWLHIPVGYHGRASSIVVSGTDFYRPHGQTKAPDAPLPSFGESKRVDFELEMAFIIGKSTQMGERVDVNKAQDYIFGMVIFNDLSARDLQTWEYVPLGPFLAKNFASVVSPWVVTMEALEEFKTQGETQIPEVFDYLKFNGDFNYDINLEVILSTDDSETTICNSNYKYMYWNMNQQLAHHTINGCNINVGDMMASGTISGPQPHESGSMLELSWKGTKPIKLSNGEERVFINDNDTIIMKAYSDNGKYRVGFGECVTKCLKAK